MIADKKCQSRKLKLWKSFIRTFFAVAFHISYPPIFFCFSFFIFSFIWNLWSLPAGKYAEFILIFGLLNIVTTMDKERE